MNNKSIFFKMIFEWYVSSGKIYFLNTFFFTILYGIFQEFGEKPEATIFLEIIFLRSYWFVGVKKHYINDH